MIARVVASHAEGRTPLNLLVGPAAVLLSIVVGVSLVSQPTLAYLPLAALGGALLLVDGRARILFVIFGGFFILQRDEAGGIDGAKMAFLAGLTVALPVAFLNVRRLRSTDAYRVVQPLVGASVVFFALAALSLPVAYANDVPANDWLRDVSAYVLFACVPIFALDARAAFSSRALIRVLVAGGALGAGAFSVAWMNRRGIAYLPVDRFALASLFVPAALFAYAVGAALESRTRRVRWVLLAAFLLALLLATGTRTTLALLVAPLAIAAGARRHLAARSIRLALIGPLAIALAVALGLVVILATGGSNAQLEERISLLRSSGDPDKDASFNDRMHVTEVAWTIFASNPVLGAGVGTHFDWTAQGGRKHSTLTLDTPLTFPAKFGLLGLAVLVALVVAYGSFLRNLVRGRDPTVARMAVLGYLAVVVALSVFASPFEDKGFSFGLILVLAIALREFEARPFSPSPAAPTAGRTGDTALDQGRAPLDEN